MATEQWEVAEGVPAVIGISQPWYLEEDEVQPKELLEQFEEWITITGFPWEGTAKKNGGAE